MDGENPLAFLGLQRVGENSPSKADNVQLNNRGLPARKRKKNSLIFGGDELVSIPVRSPRKKSPTKNAIPIPDKLAVKSSPVKSSPVKSNGGKLSLSRNGSPVKTLTPQKNAGKLRNEKEKEMNDVSIHLNSNDVRKVHLCSKRNIDYK